MGWLDVVEVGWIVESASLQRVSAWFLSPQACTSLLQFANSCYCLSIQFTNACTHGNTLAHAHI